MYTFIVTEDQAVVWRTEVLPLFTRCSTAMTAHRHRLTFYHIMTVYVVLKSKKNFFFFFYKKGEINMQYLLVKLNSSL